MRSPRAGVSTGNPHTARRLDQALPTFEAMADSYIETYDQLAAQIAPETPPWDIQDAYRRLKTWRAK
jgi:hypothetical protein